MAGDFEAKKIAWRQTKDGLVLALCVHPDDMPQEMALSPLNTRYMIAFAEIGDDEQPVDRIDKRFPNGITPQRTPFLDKVQAEPQESAANGHSKKWSEYKRSQQAYLLTRDPAFGSYFGADGATSCDAKLKAHFRVEHKSDLDDPKNHARWDEFVALYHLHRDRLR